MTELSSGHVKQALFSNPGKPGTLYRPVACLSFAFNYYVSGFQVFSYHLINISIHFVACVFLYLSVFHTLNLPKFRKQYAFKSHSVALVATMLWAVNPVHVQAVTYIVQRMASLAGMFYIMAIYCYIKARLAPAKPGKILFAGACVFSFVMSFGSKENAVLLPLSFVLYEILLIQDGVVPWFRRNWAKLLVVFSVIILLSFVYFLQRKGSLLFFLAEYEGRPFSLPQRLLTEFRVVLFYLSLLIYPVPGRLNIAHSVEISTSFWDPGSTAVSVLFVAISVAVLVSMAKKHPLISFSYLFFFLNHLIESSVFALELVFEHRNYIPSMFFFLPPVIGISGLLEIFARKKAMRTLVSAFVALVVISFGHSTFVRNFAWKSEKSLWLDAVNKSPDQFRTHHNLGSAYERDGLLIDAIAQFEEALASPIIHQKNEKTIAYYQLGKVYNRLGNTGRAKASYERAVEMDAGFSPALRDLAVLYDREGNSEKADSYLIKAMEANPEDPLINLNMGFYWLRKGLVDSAIDHLMIAMEEKVLKPDALYCLAIVYKHKGWLGRAAVCFQEIIALNPKDLRPRLHLIEILAMRGHEALARQKAAEVVRITDQDERLRLQVLDLLINKGQASDVTLSADILLPLLRNSEHDPSRGLEN